MLSVFTEEENRLGGSGKEKQSDVKSLEGLEKYAPYLGMKSNSNKD